MVNNFSNKTYLFVSKKKFIIVVYNNENKVVYKNEKLKSEKTDKLEFKFLKEFLNRNIFEIEKKINQFIKNIFLIIDLDDIYSIELSIKNKLDNVLLDNNSINSLLAEAKNSCDKTLENVNVIHMIIDRFYLDDKCYEVFPNQQNCKTFSIDLSFICISKNILKDLYKILSEYQISIEKVLSKRYLSSFLDEKDSDLFFTAQKILNGLNKNEVFLTNKSLKNKGFFEKFFNFFN
tara:strand:- start:1428 stop:2129 length:702 start_codon:yes stop_codon:yes gene_type:complete